MFQRQFAILFFGPQVITRKSSYLELTKGDTKIIKIGLVFSCIGPLDLKCSYTSQ